MSERQEENDNGANNNALYFLSDLQPHTVVVVGEMVMTPLTEQTQLEPLGHSFILRHTRTKTQGFRAG